MLQTSGAAGDECGWLLVFAGSKINPVSDYIETGFILQVAICDYTLK